MEYVPVHNAPYFQNNTCCLMEMLCFGFDLNITVWTISSRSCLWFCLFHYIISTWSCFKSMCFILHALFSVLSHILQSWRDLFFSQPVSVGMLFVCFMFKSALLLIYSSIMDRCYFLFLLKCDCPPLTISLFPLLSYSVSHPQGCLNELGN